VLRAFGIAVRELRQERGFSQEAFADAVGVHRTYIGGIERGERNVGLINVARIAGALGVSISVLMAATEART
jgi:transcriptional regulator with XRE-family HTH domain